MVLIIDNYDSFVYNIVQVIDYPKENIVVRRNDETNIDKIEKMKLEAIIISPGPMGVGEAGISREIIKRFGATIPILGICLGHQCIGDVFGYIVDRCEKPIHGRKSTIILSDSLLFDGLPLEISAGRYHSLYIRRGESKDIEKTRVIATLEDGMIMGIQHIQCPIYGIQFHPESILTGGIGKKILSNFIYKIAKCKCERGTGY